MTTIYPEIKFNYGANMKAVLANCSASISELKKNPSALIDLAEGIHRIGHKAGLPEMPGAMRRSGA